MRLFYMSSSSKSAFNKPLSAKEKQSKEVLQLLGLLEINESLKFWHLEKMFMKTICMLIKILN